MKQCSAWVYVSLLVLLVLAGRQPSVAGMAYEASIPPVPLPIWRSETAAPGVALTSQGVPGMALDPAGRPHFVYGSNRLFHAWHDGASWQVETVDPNGGALAGPAIAIDDAGTITIVAYTEAGRQRQELAAYSRAPGGAWRTASISVPGIHDYPVLALALDNDGQPHVVTTGGTTDQRPLLVYAHASVQGWASETSAIERDALGSLSLALDSRNQPVVLYESVAGDSLDDLLRLARRGATGWTNESIAHAQFIVGKSLALDSQDRAHVVFSDQDPNRLVYLRQTANGWQTHEELGDSHSPSLALDDADRPRIVYTDINEDIVYAVLGSEGWERTTIPMVGHGGTNNTLLLDETGAAHIATIQYFHSLYYATNRGGAWMAMPVAVHDEVGDKHALALGADDQPYLLYYHPSRGQVRWAVQHDDAWTTSAVADVGGAPPNALEVAAAIGPNGVAQIAYVAGAADQLIFGTRSGDAWSLAPIAAAGRNLALAVGSDNRPHLILIRDNRLAYWTRQGDAWQSEAIGPAEAAVFNAYLALDEQNRPHVVYTADGDVVAAVRRGQDDWQTEPLPVENVVGMALGPSGYLHLLTLTFRTEGVRPPRTFYTLGLSEPVAGEWTRHALFEDLYVGDDSLNGSRLLVGADGTLHIVARLTYGSLLYYRRAADGRWVSEDISEDMGGYDSSFALALGSDGQPRVSWHEDSDLRLYRREIIMLDKHVLLPVVPSLP